jgi:hypothetical protein
MIESVTDTMEALNLCHKNEQINEVVSDSDPKLIESLKKVVF